MWYCVPNYSMKCRIYPNKEQQKIIDNILYGIRVAYNVTMYEMITNLKNTKEATDKKDKEKIIHFPVFSNMVKKDWLNYLRDNYPIVKEVPAGCLSSSVYGIFSCDAKKAWESLGKKPVEFYKPFFYSAKKPRTSYSYQETFSKFSFSANNMAEMCEEFKIQHHNSTPYRPKMNGAVEAANKNIKKIIQKMTVSYKDWHEMLPFALHGYRTSVRTSTGATPFSLVYGMEAVLPFEVEVPSLRILAESGLKESEWAQTRYDQLNLIEGKRLTAMSHGRLYQQRMKNAFDKKVRLHKFHEGDLVLKKMSHAVKDNRGKWAPNYEGPFVVKRAFSGGALVLTNMDGEELPSPVNSDVVKRYYA